MAYRIGVTRDKPGPQATVFDLPGCVAQAANEPGLHGLVPVAIAEHVSWLARHGENVEGAYPIAVEVVEEIEPAITDAADGEFCFADDKQPVTDDEIERGIRWMDYATTDLLAVVETLPEDVLDWRPDASAMAKIDPWQPGVRTIREIVYELPGSERYYRLGLSEETQELEDDSLVFHRSLQREQMTRRLRGLSREERCKTFLVSRPWQDRPEHWTARKVIRRTISHERFHTKEIEQRLAWLMLGVPDFTKRTPEGATVHD